jgi:hypothetical protein
MSRNASSFPIEQEITTGNLNLFRTHALIEAQTQDYERDAQIPLILQEDSY